MVARRLVRSRLGYRRHVSVEVIAAVVASWLPRFEPPLGDNDLDTRYSDRLKVTLTVEPDDETLADVYRRAIDAWKPRVIPGSDGFVDDPIDVVHWAWFYEAADEQGLEAHKTWEVAEDLIGIAADGHARWRRSAADIPYGDLIRADEHGLLRGDPLRPYVVLLIPQGPDVLHVAWTGFLLVWQTVGHILNVRELLRIARARRERLHKGVEAARIVARYQESWATYGGGPPEILATLERHPWRPDDLRMLLGLATVAEAATLLMGYGFAPSEDGLYELSEDQEAQLLHRIADEASHGRLDVAGSGKRVEERIRMALETGQLPNCVLMGRASGRRHRESAIK